MEFKDKWLKAFASLFHWLYLTPTIKISLSCSFFLSINLAPVGGGTRKTLAISMLPHGSLNFSPCDVWMVTISYLRMGTFIFSGSIMFDSKYFQRINCTQPKRKWHKFIWIVESDHGCSSLAQWQAKIFCKFLQYIIICCWLLLHVQYVDTFQ